VLLPPQTFSFAIFKNYILLFFSSGEKILQQNCLSSIEQFFAARSDAFSSKIVMIVGTAQKTFNFFDFFGHLQTRNRLQTNKPTSLPPPPYCELQRK